MASEYDHDGNTNNELKELKSRLARRLGQASSLDEAIATATGPESVELVTRLAAPGALGDADLESRLLLGLLFWFRHHARSETDDQSHLNAAIHLLGSVFTVSDTATSLLPPPLLPVLADYATRYAAELATDAHTLPDADLDAAVRLFERIVAFTPENHPDRPVRLSELARGLWIRFTRGGQSQDLNAMVDVCRDAVAATAPEDPNSVLMLTNLGTGLLERYQTTRTPADLHEATEIGRRTLQVPASLIAANIPAFLLRLGAALFEHEISPEPPVSTEEAMVYLRAAVDRTAADDPARSPAALVLAKALANRFARTTSLPDIDEAVAMFSTWHELSPPRDPLRASGLIGWGHALVTRFDHVGNPEDLDRAVDIARAVIESSDTEQDQAHRLLGTCLWTRFEQTGAATDLDDAVVAYSNACTTAPPGQQPGTEALSGLAGALHERFRHTGALADLDEAVRLGIQARDAATTNHATCMASVNLANALRARFDRLGNVVDLDDAVAAYRTAVEMTPAGYFQEPRRLSNLGSALMERYLHARNIDDISEAVDTLRTAVALTPSDHVNKCHRLSSLGCALRLRSLATGATEDLDQAIQVATQSLAIPRSVSPDHTMLMFNLGTSYQARYRARSNPDDRDAAIQNLSGAAELDLGAPSQRVLAARTAAHLLADLDPGRAARMLELAVGLLPQVAPRHLHRSDSQHAVGGLTGLATDAAALTLSDTSSPAEQRAGSAVRLLESGRGILLGQALQMRSDITDLAQHDEALASRFVGLRDTLDRTPADLVPGMDSISFAHDRRARVREFEEVLAEIRGTPGFESFATTTPVEQLMGQARPGPIVVFNVSRYRSDALVVTTTDITAVPLPALAYPIVMDRIGAFGDALEAAIRGTTGAERRTGQRQLHDILGWLWDCAAGPVLDQLSYRPVPAEQEPPRLWWCPGGLLAMLPLHAAGYHTNPRDRSRTVMDRVVSSYTPTIGALRHARRRISVPQPDHGGKALVVAMPTTPGVPGRLDFVRREAAMLAERLPTAVTLIEPDHARAESITPTTSPTRDIVMRLLPECAIAHFACHGVVDPKDPSRSRLLLHDHLQAPFTVNTLATVHLDHARLAYLSACETALTYHGTLLDESIHLASAFQLAGYRHVVGTLWPIDDRISVAIADNFYAGLTDSDGRVVSIDRSAGALHRAVRDVRDELAATPGLWAGYTHTGA